MSKAAKAAFVFWPVVFLLIGSSFIATKVYAQDEATIELRWETPTERENGDNLPLDEIDGYEVRYWPSDAEEPMDVRESVIVPDNTAVGYELSVPAGQWDIEVAVYDTDGLYSNFVMIEPTTVNAAPGAVTGLTAEVVKRLPVSDCEVQVRCKVDIENALFE